MPYRFDYNRSTEAIMRAYGNAIVAPVAAQFIVAFLEAEQDLIRAA